MFRIGLIPHLISKYTYNVNLYSNSRNLRNPTFQTTISLDGFDIEFEKRSYWLLYLSSTYHDSFFHTRIPRAFSIPTQVTGAVGEILAINIMRDLFQATNIDTITPNPSRRSADYEMDIIENKIPVHAVVEVKASNKPLVRPGRTVVTQAIIQLNRSRWVVGAEAGYIVYTSFPSQICFVIKVF